MDTKIIAGGALAGLVLTGALIGSVSAQTAASVMGISEEQALELALMEVPGEVQEVELENEAGEMIYEIEILNAEGDEVDVEIAADSGEILEVAADGHDCDDDDDDDTEDA